MPRGYPRSTAAPKTGGYAGYEHGGPTWTAGTIVVVTVDHSGTGDPAFVTRTSPRPVADTVARLVDLLGARGLTVFDIVDHSGAARAAGLELRDTKLVIFGSPAAGTPVMVATPLAALDLPLKILVWDDEGVTRVSYTAPEALAARHHLEPALADRLAGIGPLVEALVTPG